MRHDQLVLAPAFVALALACGVTGCEGCASSSSVDASRGLAEAADGGEDAAPAASFADALTGHRQLIYSGDLDEVKKRKVLRVILRNNSTSYFLFRGDEVGFEYELALQLAKELGVRLEVVPARTRRDMIPMLLEGKGDLIAAGMPLSTARAERVVFTRPYMTVRNQVVVRKGRRPPLTKPEDLVSELVHVRRNSAAFKRLRALGELLGHTIPIAAVPEYMEVEDLIEQIASGEIPVTVARSDFIDAELTWRDDIEVAFSLDGEDEIAWAVRPENSKLKEGVDAFFTRHRKDVLFNTLHAKYFRSPKRAAVLRDDEVRADRGGRVSPYDDLLKQAAQQHNLDWRLLAAQMFQESRFEPTARSWAGAEGLMQLMPSTAAQLGVTDLGDPAQNIEAGARYLRKMIDGFSEELELKERIRFALASYNCGRGHIDDARALSRRLGYDANRWFGNTEKAMLLLSRPRYYSASKHGYCRGEEPVRYVSQIQTRYDAYVGVTGNP
ncbi:MAG: transporter substrate-binding domain-containing protein [Pseudomonadota bacterium]